MTLSEYEKGKLDQAVQYGESVHPVLAQTKAELAAANERLKKYENIEGGKGTAGAVACLRRRYRCLVESSRRRERSRTYLGIAGAMARQWGRAIMEQH